MRKMFLVSLALMAIVAVTLAVGETTKDSRRM